MEKIKVNCVRVLTGDITILLYIFSFVSELLPVYSCLYLYLYFMI